MGFGGDALQPPTFTPVWVCVMSGGELRGGILLLSSGTGEGSEQPQRFLEVHSDVTGGNGTRLKEGK